ncbi:Protein fam86a [Rhizophlyctis rosea]|nr:Protein fam86a [Rhizophlyctis rosea]
MAAPKEKPSTMPVRSGMVEAVGDWLSTIQRQYFQMVPLRQFVWPPSISLDEDNQNLLLNSTALSPLATTFPPSKSYSLRFLKTLMSVVENAKEEVCDLLYESYVSLLATTKHDDPHITAGKVCHKSYFLPVGKENIGRCITLCESEATISNGTTGLRTWEAAIRFGEYLLFDPSVVAGKRVVELGAGVGLVGFICAFAGASIVELTDIDRGVLNFLQKNVDINKSRLEGAGLCIPTVDRLDWEEATAESVVEARADVVVCADVVYDPQIVPMLSSVIRLFLQTGTESVWIASTMRHPSTFELFLGQLGKDGVRREDIALGEVPKWFHHEEEHVVLMKLVKDSSG